MTEKEILEFEHHGVNYKATLESKPFREGRIAVLKLPDGKVIRVGELGFGGLAVIEKLKAEIDKCSNGS